MKWRILLTLLIIVVGLVKLANHVHAQVVFEDKRLVHITMINEIDDFLLVKFALYPEVDSDEALFEYESTPRDIMTIKMAKNGSEKVTFEKHLVLKNIYWQEQDKTSTWYVINVADDQQPKNGDYLYLSHRTMDGGIYRSDFTGPFEREPNGRPIYYLAGHYEGEIPDESTRTTGMSNPVLW